MCDVTDGFRLCTCPAGATPDWHLYRGSTRATHMFELMRGFSPSPTEDDELRKLFIVDGLEAGACFDFDYVPQDGDVLSFPRLGAGGSSFERREGHWRVAYQDGDERGLDLLRSGDLELAAEQGLRDVPLWRDLLENPADPERRDVVVDWLLEQGRTVLAEWFQLEAAHARGERSSRFRSVAQRISLSTRALFARAPLNCDRDNCTGDWSALVRTNDPLSRRCIRCRRRADFVDHARPLSSKHQLWVADPSVVEAGA